jgi:hypothetical protein
VSFSISSQYPFRLTLEGSDRDVGDIRVKLFLGIFVIVTLTGDTDTDTVVSVLNTTSPQSLVQRGIDTDIGGTHSLLSELLDSLDSMRGALTEGTRKKKCELSLAMHDEGSVSLFSLFEKDPYRPKTSLCM